MKWFDILTKLVPILRELQNADKKHGGEIIQSEDAIIMTLGMGDAYFLTFDGRVFIEDWMDGDRPREAKTIIEATTALVIGAHKRNTPELLDMLPLQTQESRDCENCEGGWRDLETSGTFVCQNCGGLGWIGME